MSAREVIERVVARQDLDAGAMRATMGEIMDGAWAPEAIAGLLVALRMKGETAEELLGAAQALRERATRVDVVGEGPLLDTCGTGGDGTHTYNISTAVALVAAACGVRVAKHGNRSVSSRSGSADVLEALGVRIGLGPDHVARCVREVGVGFLFAPAHHGAMRHAAPVRRALGIRTLFNLIGPLTNPAGATHQLVGIYDGGRLDDVARVLLGLGAVRALVVHGSDGLDELTLAGESHAVEVRGGALRRLTVRPGDVGLAEAPTAALAGGDAAENAALLRALLSGREGGPRRDVLLLNAAAALWVAEAAEDLASGVALARRAIDEGAAARTLDGLVAASRREEDV